MGCMPRLVGDYMTFAAPSADAWRRFPQFFAHPCLGHEGWLQRAMSAALQREMRASRGSFMRGKDAAKSGAVNALTAWWHRHQRFTSAIVSQRNPFTFNIQSLPVGSAFCAAITVLGPVVRRMCRASPRL